MEKRWVQDNFANDLQWLDLEDVIPILQSAITAEVAGHWQRIRLKIVKDYDMTSIQLVGNRLETDLEYKQRMAEESKKQDLLEGDSYLDERHLKSLLGQCIARIRELEDELLEARDRIECMRDES